MTTPECNSTKATNTYVHMENVTNTGTIDSIAITTFALTANVYLMLTKNILVVNIRSLIIKRRTVTLKSDSSLLCEMH